MFLRSLQSKNFFTNYITFNVPAQVLVVPTLMHRFFNEMYNDLGFRNEATGSLELTRVFHWIYKVSNYSYTACSEL